jgi:hypothetical protein
VTPRFPNRRLSDRPERRPAAVVPRLWRPLCVDEAEGARFGAEARCTARPFDQRGGSHSRPNFADASRVSAATWPGARSLSAESHTTKRRSINPAFALPCPRRLACPSCALIGDDEAGSARIGALEIIGRISRGQVRRSTQLRRLRYGNSVSAALQPEGCALGVCPLGGAEFGLTSFAKPRENNEPRGRLDQASVAWALPLARRYPV